jgi:hypothetical protein
MKKVAATNGNKVSLADLLPGTEDGTGDAALFGVAGTLPTANFDGCLL